MGLGPDESQPTLRGFPAGGRLLAVSESGAWVVRGGGGLRGLGDYSEVGWSPRGLFVIGTRGHQLTAIEPSTGLPRWSLARRGRVSHPAWSPGDGYRVAYLESARGATGLRVVDGRGQLDHKVAAAAARVTPAWRPRGGYVLTYASAAAPGLVTVDADTGARLWTARTGAVPRELAWTRDGRRLAVLLPGALRVYGRAGRLRASCASSAARVRWRWRSTPPARGRRSPSPGAELPGPRAPAGVAIRWSGAGCSPDRARSASSPGRRAATPAGGLARSQPVAPDRPRRRASLFQGLPAVRSRGNGAGFPRLSGWCCPR